VDPVRTKQPALVNVVRTYVIAANTLALTKSVPPNYHEVVPEMQSRQLA